VFCYWESTVRVTVSNLNCAIGNGQDTNVALMPDTVT